MKYKGLSCEQRQIGEKARKLISSKLESENSDLYFSERSAFTYKKLEFAGTENI